MKRMSKMVLSALVALGFAAVGQASELSLGFEHDLAVTQDRSIQKLLRVRFTEDALIADVTLDVYALPGMPWTAEHLATLQRLDERNWWQQLKWELRGADGKPQPLKPRLVTSSARRTGPDAVRPEDQSTVARSTFSAAFDLGTLRPGDYQVKVSVGGLTAPEYPLAIRSGEEPEVRDVYLRKKASRTADWLQFKALQLERIRLDPTKADALLALAQRSIEHGTLEETQRYFDRAVGTMEHNIREFVKVRPKDADQQQASLKDEVRRIRALQRVLPEYFARRSEWRIIPGVSGTYVVATRNGNKVVKRIE
jgi:hypothetical protein